MAADHKSFTTPDETRNFRRGKVDLVNSEDVKPLVGGESCQVAHFQYVISGRLHIVMDDGTEFEVGPGDVMHCPPGHDGWVVGDEPWVAIDWTGATNFGVPT
jgi:Cupin domain